MIHALMVDFERTMQWFGIFGDYCVMGVIVVERNFINNDEHTIV